MALSGTLPVIWGVATGRVWESVWITLTAEAVTWVEMKGSFAWRVRTLMAGALLAVAFSALGTVTGFNLWLSAIAMFGVAFIATVLKNIGDRASGLAICVYLLFIFSNAKPDTRLFEVKDRMLYVAIGAAWPVVVSLLISLVMPAGQPFRRQIALIWRSIGTLVDAVSASGNEGKNMVYDREKDVRAAMNASYQFYGRMAHQVSRKDNLQYQLSQLRKIAGMVSVNVVAISSEMEYISVPVLDEQLRVKAATLFSAFKEAVNRISVYVLTLKPEESLMARSHISRLKKLASLIDDYPLPAGNAPQAAAIKRILQLTHRSIRLLENALLRIEQMGIDKPVYRSYSLLKTLYVLRPAYLLRDVRQLFLLNALTVRFALRSAIAAAAAVFIYKWFHIDHGYWLPFSVMIVIQPYFAATFRKALDRVGGTLLGGLAGSLLLHLPAGLHLKEGLLFLTFIFMVYYVRKNYAAAVFFITVNLVLLFNIEAAGANINTLMLTRALCTTGGALLAVVSGFVLLPAWDKKWLPAHLASAISSNYTYFTATFYSHDADVNWTRYKRAAESCNGDVFDSFNRYIQEPGRHKSELYYDLAIYNVRITRDLNNIHLEEDEKKAAPPAPSPAAQQAKIDECLALFHTILPYSGELSGKGAINTIAPAATHFTLNAMQLISLEKLRIELQGMQQDLDDLLHGNVKK